MHVKDESECIYSVMNILWPLLEIKNKYISISNVVGRVAQSV